MRHSLNQVRGKIFAYNVHQLLFESDRSFKRIQPFKYPMDLYDGDLYLKSRHKKSRHKKSRHKK